MSYIPTKDADLINWGANFTNLITADPTLYGLVAADALTLQTNFDEFDAAYTLAVNPATRTIVTVAAKDEEKAGFLSLARAYAAIIRANSGVTDENKAALGLTIPDPTPTPIPPPSTYPLIAVPLQGAGTLYLTVADQATPTLKKKPFGAVGALLFTKVYTTTPPDFEDVPLFGIMTKSDNIITAPVAWVAGTKVRMWPQWFNRKGELGPVGPAINVTILGT